MISAGIMLFALFTGIHLLYTTKQLDVMNFGQYLSHGFSAITPGGVVFAIPSFILWNIFDGIIGGMIVLGTTFIVSGAFLTTFIVTKQGENKIIKKKRITNDEKRITNDKNYAKDHKEISEQLESRYQELLQKQSRKKINAQKSELGLDKTPAKTTQAPIYDTAIPLDKLAPQGIGGYTPFIADEITQMSTEAANKFNQGLQQPLYSAQQFHPTTPPSFHSGTPAESGDGMVYGQPAWSAPTPSPVFNTPTPLQMQATPSMLGNYDPTDNTSYMPTSRARKTPGSFGAAAPGQTGFGDVMTAAKPPKTFKSRRYTRPPIDLIRTESTNLDTFKTEADAKQIMIDAKLKEFGVSARVTGTTVAPAITRFEITLGTGTRANDVYRMEDDFQIILGTTNIRMENVENKNAIGIEVPNKTVGCVSVKDILLAREWQTHKSPLAVAIGKNVNDEVIIGDIGSMPHLLIAGSTGSGKSVCINTILTSLIYRAHPDDVKLLLVDMKLVELGMYNGIPHMLIPRSIGEVQQAIHALKWMQDEMRRRYKILQANGLKHISQYQSLPNYQSGTMERMPYILMVIDEAADLIYTGKREVEDAVKQLAALGRASGIHLILATQRPSVDVITAVIKANLPVRMGFKTVSRGDSQTITGETGCEKLVGRGDMLFSKEGKMQRIQGAYIEDEEARRVMNYIRENNTSDFDSELEDLILNGPPPENAAVGFGDGPAAARSQDPAFVPILRWLVRDENHKRIASIAGVQRQFALGFGRAGRIMDQMTAMGYVSEDNGQKGRMVLITREEVDNLYGPG